MSKIFNFVRNLPYQKWGNITTKRWKVFEENIPVSKIFRIKKGENISHINHAIITGDIETVKQMHNAGIKFEKNSVNIAIQNKNTEMIKYFKSIGYIKEN